ncbi:MAG: hypothetical protein QM669_02645 [Siphonobacter sp.]
MQFILIVILSAMVQYFLPWWSVVLIPFFLSAWKGTSGFASFLNGLLASGLLWLALAWFEHSRSAGVLTSRISSLFMNIPATGLMTITALVGGLLGGMAALSGYFLRNALWPRIQSDLEKGKAYW